VCVCACVRAYVSLSVCVYVCLCVQAIVYIIQVVLVQVTLCIILMMQVQNPLYLLGEYLMHASTAEQLDRNPLMEPTINDKVQVYTLQLD